MNKTNQQRIDGFLDQMEEALPGPGRRKEEIRNEVESDLHEMIDAASETGQSEDEAVDSALEQMGNPYEVAHKIGRVVTPASHSAIKILRYLVAGGVAIWTLFLCWGFRPWSYGAEGTAVLAVILLFHVPVIALAWPGIIWRMNWLFGLVPAGLAIGIAFATAMGGVTSSSEIEIPVSSFEEAVIQSVQIEESSTQGTMPRWGQLLLLAGVFLTFLVILLSIQQARQRRWVVGITVLAFLVVEGPFRLEEIRFRGDWKEIRGWADTFRETENVFPTKGQFRSSGLSLHNDSLSFSRGEDGYSLFWNRPLSRGFALVADSREDSIRVQD